MPSTLDACGPIAPPFKFNAPSVSKFSPEVTGRIIIKSMCERLGWPSLAGKRVLDFGCGVRFACTIFNLEMEVAFYAGVDVDNAAITWLKENVNDPRFWFARLSMHNAMYNPTGLRCATGALRDMGLEDFDVACMFSVITHQKPEDAELVFSMLRPCAQRLYFTAFIDEAVDGYMEKDPDQPCHMSTYSSSLISELLLRTGWRIEAVHAPMLFQQTTFVCSPIMSMERS
jgi:hypothetical protein